MESLGLGISLPHWFVLLLFGAMLPFVWWSYRTSRPELTRSRRFTLILLRSLALVALILVLADLFVTHGSFQTEVPRIDVHIDDSRSMAQAPDGRSRFVIATDIAREIETRLGADRSRMFRFSDSVSVIDLSSKHIPPPTGTPTDLSLRSSDIVIRNRNRTGAVVLISDGHHNSGEDPASRWSELGLPVVAIVPGPSTGLEDARVSGILTNRVGRVGVEQLVSIKIDANVESERTVVVLLRSSSGILGRYTLTLLPTLSNYQVTLPFRPIDPGTKILTAEIQGLSSEAPTANNRRQTVVEVPSSKARLLLIGGAPGPDLAFFRRKIESMPDIEVESVIHVGQRPLPLDESILRSMDVVALINYPTASSTVEELQRIEREIRRRSVPLLIAFGPNTDLRRLSGLGDILPLALDPETSFDRIASISATKDFSDRLSLKQSAFKDLAPLTIYTESGRLASSAETLLFTDDQRRTPVVIASDSPTPTTLIAGWGLWRWELLDKGRSEARGETAPPILEEFVTRSVRALGRAGKRERFSLTIDPSSSLLGETLIATAEVYTGNFQPLIDAVVSVTITGPERRVVRLDAVGGSRYTARLDKLPKGTYRYSGIARAGGNHVGSAAGSFVVEDRHIEDTTLSPDFGTMKSIAERSDGYFGTGSDVDSLMTLLLERPELSPRSIPYLSETSLRNSLPFLILALLHFSAEWILRRRWGLL